MDRPAYIIDTIRPRLTAEQSLLVPMFVRSDRLTQQPNVTRFGWAMPQLTNIAFLGNAPRHTVYIAPEVIALQTHHLDDNTFMNYVDALVLYLILHHLEMARGIDRLTAERNVVTTMLDKHKEHYRILNETQLSILDN